MPELSGKIAIVTGASRGIGRAIAIKLATLGADVAIIYSGNAEKAAGVCKEIEELGVRARAYKCDVSKLEECKEAVKLVSQELGKADILINNAGITRDGLILSMKEEDYDAVLNTNLKGAFNMIHSTYRDFIRRRSGRIINISSVSGIIGNVGQANYSASKAGLIGLTKAAARELAERNVTVNAIAPGFIETDMTRDIEEGNPLYDMIPLKRMGSPEDIAACAAFLAGDGGAYITGEVIKVDGGLAI